MAKILHLVILFSVFLCMPLNSALSSELGQRLQIGENPMKTNIPNFLYTGIEIDGLKDVNTAATLQRIQQDIPLKIRGAKDIEVYEKHSPSVVLIVTTESIGSGTLISEKQILTNMHVVGRFKEVGVFFKPKMEGRKLKKADLIIGEVTKIDEVRDLAMISLKAHPPDVKPIKLGNPDNIRIGADVHAIGHPTGESWTYTKGIISQIRSEYKWLTDLGLQHIADVIQTQTPINPGNSGGPLLNDNGELIGVNSFKASGEALNFAVSVRDVQKFIGSKDNRYAVRKKQKMYECNEVLYEGRDKKDEAFIRVVDITCNGKPDLIFSAYDNWKSGCTLAIDSNQNGNIDIIVFDETCNEKWDYSLHDKDHDGEPDLIGYHPDGEIKPSRFEKYK